MPDIELSNGHNSGLPGSDRILDFGTGIPKADKLPTIDLSGSDDYKIFRNTLTVDDIAPKSFDLDAFLASMKPSKVKGSDLTPVNFDEVKDGARYDQYGLGYRPDLDNEDIYANNMPWYKSGIVTFIPKLALQGIAKIGQGAGFLGGLAVGGVDRIFNPSKSFDLNLITEAGENGFSQLFNSMEDTVRKDWFGTYQEAEDRDKGFFSRMFTDGNFWSEDFVDGAAFLLSAFVPGMLISKLALGAKVLAAASKLEKFVSFGENAVLGASKWGTKAARYLKNAERIKTGIDKTTITLLNTASESMFEAKGVRDNVIKQLSQDRLDGKNDLSDEDIKNKLVKLLTELS